MLLFIPFLLLLFFSFTTVLVFTGVFLETTTRLQFVQSSASFSLHPIPSASNSLQHGLLFFPVVDPFMDVPFRGGGNYKKNVFLSRCCFGRTQRFFPDREKAVLTELPFFQVRQSYPAQNFFASGLFLE
jgi:hypothetical protein